MAINKKKVIEILVVVWAKVSGWCLAQISMFWEEYLRNAIKEEIDKIVQTTVSQLKELRSTEDYSLKRDAVYDALFEKIKLPLFAKPFKGIIKVILKGNVTRKVDEIMDRLDKSN